MRVEAPPRWRTAGLLAVLVVGVVLGAVVTLIVQDRGAAEDDRDARRTQTAAVAPGGAGRDGTGNGSGNGADVGAPTKQVLLAWQVDPLPDGLVETVAAIGGVEQATAVRQPYMSQGQPQTLLWDLTDAIRQLTVEHGAITAQLRTLRELRVRLDDSSELPQACRPILDALAALEAHLHEYMFLENCVLFPRALAMEAHAPV